jgi:transposase InsO family protein
MSQSFNVPPPEPIKLHDGNVETNFREFKHRFELWFDVCAHENKAKKRQVAILLYCAGKEISEAARHFTYDDPTQADDWKIVMTKIEAYCAPQQSEWYYRQQFQQVKWDCSTFEDFLSQLRSKIAQCKYGNNDDMLIEKIIAETRDKDLQLELLKEQHLTLATCIAIVKTHIAAKQQLKTLDQSRKPNAESKISKVAQHQQGKDIKLPCKFCPYEHVHKKEKCPAYGKQCTLCKKENHFASKCPEKQKKNYTDKQKSTEGKKPSARATRDDGPEESEEDNTTGWLSSVRALDHKQDDEVYASMTVNNKTVDFLVDSGATVQTIPEEYVHPTQLIPEMKPVKTWTKEKVSIKHKAFLDITNPVTGQTVRAEFKVTPNNLTPLLSKRLSEQFGIISFNHNNFQRSKVNRATQPEGEVNNKQLGYLGTIHLHLKPGAHPKILPARKVPHSLLEKAKQAITDLVDQGVLTKVQDPTDWVSQMVIVEKQDGSLRVCIDPSQLNKSLMREQMPMPTLDDILPHLKDARIFSKVDVKSAFHHIVLDEESSKLTTMATPFGRYRWLRLPFGLNVSSEVFQARLMQALEELPGIFIVADDIIVTGSGSTQEDAEHDHDKNLRKLYERCDQKNIILNKKKEIVKTKQLQFLGHRITPEGIKPDPDKISAIHQMPAPSDPSQVRSLLGMITYMAKFIPHLAELSTPLRLLTQKNVAFIWKEDHCEALTKIKDALTSDKALAYYDPTKELVLQADASQNALGAVILQDGKPIEFASRAMTPTEKRYAQIEKECLSIVFGLERFNQYTYGRKTLVQNDHKPLEVILKKPLSAAPKRLQTFMMRLNKYDYDINYLPGSEVVIADALSRNYLDVPNAEQADTVNVLKYIEASDSRLKKIKEENKIDKQAQLLITTIQAGWPDAKKNISPELQPFFDVRDTLTVEDGIILKGERLFIPTNMRPEVKQLLHAAHLGKDSMMRRARDTVYWPGMNAEITQIAQSCDTCLKYAPGQQQQPLQPHHPGDGPWDKIAADIATFNKKNYLITVDYYSSFIEIDLLTSMTSTMIIQKLKSHFARYGVPRTLVSDNAQQFVSDDFENFCQKWHMQHSTSSPTRPEGNGKAESAVKQAKLLLKKTTEDNSDQYIALMEYRNTPQQSIGMSPAERLLGRPTRTLLPVITAALKPKPTDAEAVKEKIEHKQAIQKRSFDKHAKKLAPLEEGMMVYVDLKKQHSPQKWTKGKVVKKHSFNSYIVETDNGQQVRRNRIDIRTI